MKFPRIMLAAPKSGSGKTVLTCALLQYLSENGKNPCAFKCGPDYIDPMFHKRVIGVPARNLDSYFCEKTQLKRILTEGARGEIGIIEGVMGLYDGLGGTREAASSYEVADQTGTPVILVVDAKGMGRTLLPLLAGMRSYDRKNRIRGVILNKVSGMFYPDLKRLIEEELSLPVLGYVPEQKVMQLESRHLGLVLPHELDDLKQRLHEMAELLGQTVEVERLLEIAEQAALLDGESAGDSTAARPEDGVKSDCRIGVAMDEAFCFYYEENLRLLEKMGAELVPFSPLQDERLPDGLHGLLFGGGYPELCLGQLNDNVPMRQAVKEAVAGGMPTLAECGGFMYLHERVYDEQGIGYPMVGVQPGVCKKQNHLVRFGYVELTATESGSFLEQGDSIRGHEFHYYDSTDNGAFCHAAKPTGNRSWACVHANGHSWWGFPHLYYASNPEFARAFVRACEEQL